jgi:hypothetical protein
MYAILQGCNMSFSAGIPFGNISSQLPTETVPGVFTNHERHMTSGNDDPDRRVSEKKPPQSGIVDLTEKRDHRE